MSPKIRVLRKVLNPPIIDGFKPYGQESVMMGVSMPTCTRIYASALQNVAKAFIKGRQITIKGGKVNFDRYNKCAGSDCF